MFFYSFISALHQVHIILLSLAGLGALRWQPDHLPSLQEHHRIQESVLTGANSRNQGSSHQNDWEAAENRFRKLVGSASGFLHYGHGLTETFEN